MDMNIQSVCEKDLECMQITVISTLSQVHNNSLYDSNFYLNPRMISWEFYSSLQHFPRKAVL